MKLQNQLAVFLNTTTALYYDDRGRVVQSRSTNHLGGYDIVYNAYDFTGNITKTYKTHAIQGLWDSTKELYSYTYDKAQRLLTTTHQLNGGSTVALVSNTYDELGRLQSKNLGGADTTTYAYNVRSWVKDITSNKFTENLYYNANTANLPSFTPAYNGNIAGMQWNVPNESLGYNRAYTFGYDGLNRLTGSIYCGFNGSAVSGTVGKYNEATSYDKMGNIKSLSRNENGTLINNLSFTYIGNQMKKVDNAVSLSVPYGSEAFNDKQKITTEYQYDKNGSITSDVNSGISTIQYNLLNLPDIIQFTEGHKNIYTYDAGGKKLEAINYTVNSIVNVPIGTISTLPSSSSDYTKLTTDYIGNMIYENGSLKEILLPEGYYQGGVYYYYLKDHLGSNRVVLRDDNTLLERNHYYPSGMRFGESAVSGGSVQPYRHTGHEMQSMHGLNWIDNGARMRSVNLPIFTTVDPLAEKYYSISPYVYCHNNPVNRIDPDGRWDIDVHAYNDRGKSGYAVFIARDRNGNEVYRTVVKTIGTGGRTRDVKNSDTPQGTYKILSYRETGEGTKYDKVSYGPNDLLALDYRGEEGGKRNGMHVHGGRQEGKYEGRKDLASTWGCMRINDADILELQNITTALEKNDPLEKGGFLNLIDDLQSPVKYSTSSDRYNAGTDQFPKTSVKRKNFELPVTFSPYIAPNDNTRVVIPYRLPNYE